MKVVLDTSKVKVISADDFVELLTGVRPVKRQKPKTPK
jgi:hypothetical protein